MKHVELESRLAGLLFAGSSGDRLGKSQHASPWLPFYKPREKN